MNEFFTEEVIKLLASLLVGAIIGAEREYRSKAAGFRTVILITMGSCLFTLLSMRMGAINDEARIAANIVTGIGFLGAGAIYRDKISIRGLTTATTIWVAAALGMAIGCGEFKLAFMVTGVVMVILLSFSRFQEVIEKVHQEKNYKITFEPNISLVSDIEELFDRYKLSYKRVKQIRYKDDIIIIFAAEGKERNHKLFTKELYKEKKIKGFEV